MHTIAKGKFGFAAVLMLAFAAPHPAPAAEKRNGPVLPQPCMDAAEAEFDGATGEAADKHLACANFPGQTPYLIASSRLSRVRYFEQVGKEDLAEAELVILTTPPISRLPVFTGVDVDYVSVSETQVELLAMRANYRLADEDRATARELADRAIALAGYDPAYVFDAAAAFEVRAKVAGAENQSEAALRLAIRAYFRGSDDPWIRALVTTQTPQTQAELMQVRKHIFDQVGPYAKALTPEARASRPADELAKTIAAAKTTMAQMQAMELAQLGPL